MAEPLRDTGHRVYTPTQTGLGERSHLISNDVTLDVFVQDLVNVFEWEDLNDAILVRHSFGGIASTGAPSGGRSDESARELEEPHRR